MSRRSALSGVDREAFIKAQIVSVHKALNKNEVPLKQKHVRVLIVGTHKEKSSSVFWNTISRIQLEKNPIVSWKFCHCLHKLIRDGHPKVVEETQRYTQRIVQLGNFWQHLHTSGYGLANSAYCKLLVNRLAFLKRNHSFPGSLHLSETQINTLVNSDVNQSFEIAIEMLDQMDDLLNLQSIVFEAMGVVRWNSLTPQGQCLLAPLILVIVDASKFYDYLVKVIFRLHGQIPADALSGHRERFNAIFRKIKKFFEMAANLQYFKYLVTIPDLPDQAPNFLRASDLDTYQTPQAVLHGDDISESDSPPDGMSVADESLVDISEPAPSLEAENFLQNRQDDKDIMIETLRRDLEDARLNQARLMNEARSRIEQYENRLLQVKHESDHFRQTLDEMKEENDRLRAASVLSERHAVDETRLQDAERRAQNTEQNFSKMKNAYANLRQEHIQALTKLSNAQKDLTNAEAERLNKEEAMNSLERRLKEIERERSLVEEKARGAASNVDDLQGQLAKCQIDIENLNKIIEDLNASNTKELDALKARNQELEMKVADAQREKGLVEERARCSADDASSLSVRLASHVAEIEALKKMLETREAEATQRLGALQNDFRSQLHTVQSRFYEYVCRAIEEFLLHSRDELQSATSISYPIQLALPAIRNDIEALKKLITLVRDEPTPELIHALTLLSHNVADTVVNSAAAAYTMSIQHFEPIHEQCRTVAVNALHSIAALKILDYKTAGTKELPKLLNSLEKLEELCLKLPAASGDVSAEQVGAMLEDEMKRMDSAIQNALKMLEEMQKKSRATNSGIRLEVNEKILDSCNALMAAIIRLVARSRAMQEEIVALGRGTASPNEFYKRNHQWTEGLLSAAKAVGAAANVLVKSADGAVTGKGKLEYLIVASQEIAASTAQLFVSSRVKADRDSKRLADLAIASKSVNTCTANVVATVKSGQQTLSDSQNLDFSHLSLHEAKKEEMESQVRTLELEAELMRERARFAELRKQHYHLASLVANQNGTEASS